MSVNWMDFRDDLSTASDYLRMAVPLMVRRKIPPTPYNYALWYAHVQNAHPDLSRALLAQFPEGESYDPEKSEALFFEYFVKNYLPTSPRESERRARLDALTKIPNRRSFDEALTQSLSADDEPTCLLLMDLDRFTQLNDTYGHAMGNRVLESVGGVLAPLQSDQVFVARYGGEEFAVIVHDELDVAQTLAEQIRRQVAALQIKHKSLQDTIGTITVSIGLTRFRPGEAAESLIERADTGLYRAKDGGRDRVVIA